ncbi:thioredoxin-like protein [Acephala macrosclerotiorum]|nr:thioredoxin-like protein [Acephala macrosclerotiorum]
MPEAKINSLSHLKNLLTSYPFAILDFNTTWCGPCRQIAPIFSRLAYGHPKLLFAKIDVDKQDSLAKEYIVTSIPTFVVLQNGKVVNRIERANERELRRAVEKLAEVARGARRS